jgi:hypothetical protein
MHGLARRNDGEYTIFCQIFPRIKGPVARTGARASALLPTFPSVSHGAALTPGHPAATGARLSVDTPMSPNQRKSPFRTVSTSSADRAELRRRMIVATSES